MIDYKRKVTDLEDEMIGTMSSYIRRFGRESKYTTWQAISIEASVLDYEYVQLCMKPDGRLCLIDTDQLHYNIHNLSVDDMAILVDWIQRNYR